MAYGAFRPSNLSTEHCFKYDGRMPKKCRFEKIVVRTSVEVATVSMSIGTYIRSHDCRDPVASQRRKGARLCPQV